MKNRMKIKFGSAEDATAAVRLVADSWHATVDGDVLSIEYDGADHKRIVATIEQCNNQGGSNCRIRSRT
jgi:hypothetical protein